MIATRDELEASGVDFRIYAGPTEIMPGIWVTGPIERVHPEKNYAEHLRVVTEAGVVPDYIPESQGLAVNTRDGFVVVPGCGHAGIVNTVHHAQAVTGVEQVHAVIGGFHLGPTFFHDRIQPVVDALVALEPAVIAPAHCTGHRAASAVYQALPAAFVQNSVGPRITLTAD